MGPAPNAEVSVHSPYLNVRSIKNLFRAALTEMCLTSLSSLWLCNLQSSQLNVKWLLGDKTPNGDFEAERFGQGGQVLPEQRQEPLKTSHLETSAAF